MQISKASAITRTAPTISSSCHHDTVRSKGWWALPGWGGVEQESENGSGYEKTYIEHGQIITKME